jgi:peptide deformylase
MTIRQIVYSDDPSLREPSHRVQEIDSDVQDMIDDMLETMHANDGVGLAAIQIGVPERVIVVEVPVIPETEAAEDVEPEDLEIERHVLINPKLVRTSRETEPGIEGCLSIPGWVGEVDRHRYVTVRGWDRSGKEVRIKAEGLLARVFQHEIDHCKGILFVDRIEDPDKIWAVEEGQEEAVEASQQLPDQAAV